MGMGEMSSFWEVLGTTVEADFPRFDPNQVIWIILSDSEFFFLNGS